MSLACRLGPASESVYWRLASVMRPPCQGVNINRVNKGRRIEEGRTYLLSATSRNAQTLSTRRWNILSFPVKCALAQGFEESGDATKEDEREIELNSSLVVG